ncbi:hypothetical protein GCM10027073_46810 [Streptomyces chlorus]
MPGRRRVRGRYRRPGGPGRVGAVSGLRLELPYEFHRDDYEQILHDVRHLIAPELGWKPGAGAE